VETEKSLTQLFTLWAEQVDPPIIELLDINQRPVGALYLNKFLNKGQLVISETNNKERYYFYCDGVGIYFSFFKKLSR
jgi:hypothetical protein